MTDNRTTELRKLLTERGVKWWPMRNNGYYEDRDTEFVVNGKKHTAHEWGDGLAVYNLTPEQAIAATLGNEREKELEELARDMWREITTCPDYPIPPCMTRNICDRIRELEIGVDDDER